MDNDKKGRIKGLWMMASMGMTLAVSTLLGLAAGLYLDSVFNTAPILMLIFLVIGVAAGFKNIYTTIKKYGF